MQSTGHTAMHGASEQCMHATEIERSPGTPSLMVTTRRRFTPHGTSFSCLHAVTQALHSMHRSASHRNFIRAMVGVSSTSNAEDDRQRVVFAAQNRLALPAIQRKLDRTKVG